MQSAEKRRTAEKQYREYGFDVRPKVVRKTRQQRSSAKAAAIDRGRLLILLFVVGLICLGIIITAAWGASINYTNNQLRDSNAELQSEVDTLQVQLQSENNIAKIQQEATGELNMQFAEGDSYVDLSNQGDVPDDLAVVLKENAYK